MSAVWNFLCGEVPGGFAVPLVLIIAFFPVLVFVYKAGEYMKRSTYLRWRWLGPSAIIFIYALFWLQAPPKIDPLRVAVIPLQSDNETDWRLSATVDLTARRIDNTLTKAVVNPWIGSRGEYSQPSADVLIRSGYRVFQLQRQSSGDSIRIGVYPDESADASVHFVYKNSDLLKLSHAVSRWILDYLNRDNELSEPFGNQYANEALEAYYQGCEYLKMESSDSAAAFFKSAIDSDSTFLQARIGLAHSYEIAGDHGNASIEMLSVAQTEIKSSEALLCLGELFLRSLNWEDAEPPLKIVLTDDPLAIRACLGLARIHPERLKDLRLDTPDKLLVEAIRLDPAFENARIALTGPLVKQGKVYRARKLLTEGLDINPLSIDLLLKMGALELNSGNIEVARDYYDKIMTLEPQSAIAAFNLGIVDYKTKDYDSAIKNFRNSMAWDGPVDCFYYLGLLYQKTDDLARAKLFFNKRWEFREDDDDYFAIKAKELSEAIN
ncbi:hypothetical protein CEE37_11260 [candidate division LCP-89 bacterium B3_LCP]|uniref:Tetratricopeptide repeat protein n=1 Tax=candidate division LCP-89 bacterium B3_LCP TaxID=2012998 RepID=A0A532UY30_UNCL8|nr:MAG: hypothetical protein CEE37_11260 [candidate division LCP-89 bacterium B3_LCP]